MEAAHCWLRHDLLRRFHLRELNGTVQRLPRMSHLVEAGTDAEAEERGVCSLGLTRWQLAEEISISVEGGDLRIGGPIA